ncbi:uncharacterized protein LOC105383271 [Plutella xylostella]|uniref:uncharacterized protein LOC105383271 n=1 Tax=Plutella xylostella TaxID=51655 RepID=UPI0020326F87|nr:uncharacterized protein LOC105383271 [Plutella xylostella]
MKKGKQGHGLRKSRTSKNTDTNKTDRDQKAADTPAEALLDDDETGFGGWLKSADGMDTMKLFVIANSIVVVSTLALPHVQTVFDILYEAIYGSDSYF